MNTVVGVRGRIEAGKLVDDRDGGRSSAPGWSPGSNGSIKGSNAIVAVHAVVRTHGDNLGNL